SNIPMSLHSLLNPNNLYVLPILKQRTVNAKYRIFIRHRDLSYILQFFFPLFFFTVAEIVFFSVRVCTKDRKVRAALDIFMTKSRWYNHSISRSHINFCSFLTAEMKCRSTAVYNDYFMSYTVIMMVRGHSALPYTPPVVST